MNSNYRTPSDIHPCLTYQDAYAAIDWLCTAFGFTKQFVVPGPDKTVMHSELSLGTGVVMVSSRIKHDVGIERLDSSKVEHDARARISAGSLCMLSVYVQDPDTHCTRAVAAGAKIIQPLRNEDYGARGYMAEDLEGHQWYFGNYRPGAYWEHSPNS